MYRPPPGKIEEGKGQKAVKCLTDNTMSRAVSVHSGHTETRKHLDYKLRKTFTSKISRSEWLKKKKKKKKKKDLHFNNRVIMTLL